MNETPKRERERERDGELHLREDDVTRSSSPASDQGMQIPHPMPGQDMNINMAGLSGHFLLLLLLLWPLLWPLLWLKERKKEKMRIEREREELRT